MKRWRADNSGNQDSAHALEDHQFVGEYIPIVSLAFWHKLSSDLRQVAPDATTSITLGDSSADEFGTWASTTSELVHLVGREITVDLPAASAALVSMHV